MHFAFTPEETTFRQDLREFLKAELPPDWKGADEYGRTDDVEFERYMRRRLIERDWLTMAWPREYGGQDASNVKMAIFAEEMMYHEAPGKDGSGVGLLAPAVMRHGTPEQKRKYLPPIANGEVTWAQGFSEPESGSDLASLRTRAIKDGDDYLITGQKIWSSGAHLADWMFVLARTDPDAPKHRGITYFLVDMKTPGITVRPIINMVGDHHFNEEYFDNVRVPAENIVGELNRGWYAAMTTLNFERDGTMYTAKARKPLDMLIELMKEEGANGFREGNDAGPATPPRRESRGDRGQQPARLPDRLDGRPGSRAPARGLDIQAHQQRAVDEGRQHGDAGPGPDGPAGRGSKWAPLRGKLRRLYLWSVSETIGGGTSEIQRNIIATRGSGSRGGLRL